MNVSRETLAFETLPPSHAFSRETLGRLRALADLILDWNTTVNLVARGDQAALWDRHIEDSLRFLPLIPPATDRIVDLGSGAGFPGLVVAIATGLHVVLVEADLRKAAFLREAARVTRADAAICAKRIEACGLSPTQLVTARALAPLPKLLGLAHPLLQPGGTCLFSKGRRVAEELSEARQAWAMEVEQRPDGLAPDGCILKITGLRRV